MLSNVREFFAKIMKERFEEQAKKLPYIARKGLLGSRRMPLEIVDREFQVAGTVVRKATKTMPEKKLKQSRTVIKCKTLMTGRYVPGGNELKLGR